LLTGMENLLDISEPQITHFQQVQLATNFIFPPAFLV